MWIVLLNNAHLVKKIARVSISQFLATEIVHNVKMYVNKIGFTLTHHTLVPHIYVSVNHVSIGSDNGLAPIRRQAII